MLTETDPAPPGVRLYTVEEVAELLHCSASYLHKLVQKRAIPSTKIARRVLFSEAHLLAVIKHFERPAVRR